MERIRTRKFKFRALDSRESSLSSDLGDSTQTIQSRTSNESDIFSSFNCDGEVLSDTYVTVSGHCQMLKVFRRQSMIDN